MENESDYLSPEQACMLLNSGGVLDEYLMSHMVEQGYPPTLLVFQLPDGRVLQAFSTDSTDVEPAFNSEQDWHPDLITSITTFSSREHFLDCYKAAPDYAPLLLDPEDIDTERLKYFQTHPLESVQPYGPRFPEYVPGLIELLPERLNLSPDVLDGTFWSLGAVDDAVSLMGGDALHPVNFVCLIAYTGEVIRTAVKGQWNMVADLETDMESQQEQLDYEHAYSVVNRVPSKIRVDSEGRLSGGTLGELPVDTLWEPSIATQERSWERVFRDMFELLEYGSPRCIATLVRGCIWHTLSPEEKLRSEILVATEEY